VLGRAACPEDFRKTLKEKKRRHGLHTWPEDWREGSTTLITFKKEKRIKPKMIAGKLPRHFKGEAMIVLHLQGYKKKPLSSAESLRKKAW